ncbi:limonene-1,2-epoxide hydrolase family protein [Gordonia aurantiaca]|uniref:limonene-1,2-epoxide hydrolase family protein n=1 Tax=Gordonia sp. B21 TaxID=3151852 RepID=UPI003265E1AB
MTSQTPIEIVTAFLNAFARGDTTTAMENADDDIVWINVSLPAIRGKKKVAAVLGGMDTKPWAGFNYRMVNISSDDAGVALTERVDELRFGKLHLQFWVCGRFEIREGRIAVWRDYFDWFDMAKSLGRGVLALVVPSLQRPLPAPQAVPRSDVTQ